MRAVEAIAAQLAAQNALPKAKGALELAAALERRQFSDEGYVIMTAADPDKNDLINAVSQRVTEHYSIVFWVRSINDPTGEAASAELDTKIAAINTALLGWAPDADRGPLEYAGGKLGQFVSGGVLWEEMFVTETYVRAT